MFITQHLLPTNAPDSVILRLKCMGLLIHVIAIASMILVAMSSIIYAWIHVMSANVGFSMA